MTPYDFLEQATATIPSNRQAREVRQELLSHLLLKQAELEENGLDPTQAEAEAIQSMGSPADIAEDYAIPETRLKFGWALVGVIPLGITAIVSLENGGNILMWLAVMGTIAVIAEPGRTLNGRLRGLWHTVQKSSIIVAAGAAAGLVTALATFSIGSWGAVAGLFEFFGPWLAVLYSCWQRSSEHPATPLSMVWVTNGAFWLMGGSAYLLLHATASSRVFGYDTLHPMVVVGLSLTISEWALAHLWDGVQWLRTHQTRFAKSRPLILRTISQADSPTQSRTEPL